MIKTSLIAPCGMNCGTCMAYLRDKNTCPGCRVEDPNKTISILRCKIKNCEVLQQGNAKFCFKCDSFPCKQVKHMDKRYRTRYNMSVIENLENIRRFGIRKFVANENIRWACPNCGGTICVHRQYCYGCGKQSQIRRNTMSKPTTRNQIIETAQTERAALEKLLATLTPEQMTQSAAVDDWSAKDVLAHLIEWEGMVMKWYETGAKGKIPAVPSEKYNWGQLPQLNHAIYLKHRDRSLAEVQKDFKSSYKKIMKFIESITEKELFTRGQYTWTRNNLLAAYFTSATSSHYRWARGEIRKKMKK